MDEAIEAAGDEPSSCKDSGVAVYSMNVDVSDITPESDPEAYELVHKPEWMAYAGPYISVLTSPSVSDFIKLQIVSNLRACLLQRNYTNFSIQVFVPDPMDSEDSWDKEVSIDKLAEHEPLFSELFGLFILP